MKKYQGDAEADDDEEDDDEEEDENWGAKSGANAAGYAKWAISYFKS